MSIINTFNKVILNLLMFIYIVSISTLSYKENDKNFTVEFISF